MNKAIAKYIIAVLFGFCAGMLVCKYQPVFAEIDLSDERATMFQDMNAQSADIEQIQDVFGNDDISDAEITTILNTGAPKVAAKKEEEKPVQVVVAPRQAPKEIPKVPVAQVVKKEVVVAPEAPVEIIKPVPAQPTVVVQPKAEPVKEEKPVQVAMIPKEIAKPAPVKEIAVKKGPSKPVKKVSLKELQSRLALTDAQVKRLAPIMKQKGDRRTEIIRKYAGKGEKARPAFMRDMELFRQYYDDMYSHIMTDDQWNQYLQIREEQKNKANS